MNFQNIYTFTYQKTLLPKLFGLFLKSSKAFSISLTKENSRMKQVSKENGYQDSIISKIFNRITNNHSLCPSQQQIQATNISEEEIRMSINLPYVEGTSENLRRILRSHKIRSTFYNETLCVNCFVNRKIK